MSVNGNRQLWISLLTGKITETETGIKKGKEEYEVPISHGPKPSCKKCHGRGFFGKHVNPDYYMICSCLKSAIQYDLIEKD